MTDELYQALKERVDRLETRMQNDFNVVKADIKRIEENIKNIEKSLSAILEKLEFGLIVNHTQSINKLDVRVDDLEKTVNQIKGMGWVLNTCMAGIGALGMWILTSLFKHQA